MESENINEFLYSVKLKSVGLLYILSMDLLPMYDFVIPCIGHWRIQIYWVMQMFQNLMHFITQCWKKSHSITSPSISLKESFNIGKVSGSVTADTSFQKSSFSLRSSNFIIDNKYQQLFSLKYQAPFVCFEEMSAKHPVWESILYHLVFQKKKKDIPWKKMTHSTLTALSPK